MVKLLPPLAWERNDDPSTGIKLEFIRCDNAVESIYHVTVVIGAVL